MTKIIEAKNVRKLFANKTEALRGANLSIEAGEIVAILPILKRITSLEENRSE